MERHPFDAISFAFGLFFLGVGLVLVTGTVGAIPMNWVGPLVAIGVGVVIIAASWPGRPRGNEEEDSLPE